MSLFPRAFKPTDPVMDPVYLGTNRLPKASLLHRRGSANNFLLQLF